MFAGLLVASFTLLCIAQSLEGDMKMWLGVIAGCALTIYVALRDEPPQYIENWRTGAHGEARTAKALKSLTADGWTIRHDVAGRGRGNIDHILVRGRDVLLLDTKNWEGIAEITAEGFRVTYRHLDISRVEADITRRIRGASAALSERFSELANTTPFVHPVVVLWMDFPQGVAEHDGVTFVHGSEVAAWVRGRARLEIGPVRGAGLLTALEQMYPN